MVYTYRVCAVGVVLYLLVYTNMIYLFDYREIHREFIFGHSNRSNRDKEISFTCAPAVLVDWDPAKLKLSKTTSTIR